MEETFEEDNSEQSSGKYFKILIIKKNFLLIIFLI